MPGNRTITLACALLATGVLLSPAVVAWLRRSFRLMHPNILVPIYFVYQLWIPVAFALGGSTMKKTTLYYADLPGFLAYPLLLQILSFLFFAGGVVLGGCPLVPRKQDLWDLDRPDLPVFRGASPMVLFVTGISLMLAATGVKLLELHSYAGGIRAAFADIRHFIFDTGYGHYWMHVLFTSSFLIPVVLLASGRVQGIVALLLAAPLTLLAMSKAGIMQVAAGVVTYFQERIFAGGRGLILVLVMTGLLAFMVPWAVALYRGEAEPGSWGETGAALLNREYAFELFAVIVEESRQGTIAHTHGAWILSELTQFVPRAFWPGKPFSRALGIGTLYMPMDFSPLYPMFVSPHFLGLLYVEGGVVATVVGSVILGSIMGFGYSRAQQGARSRGDRLPLLLFLSGAVNFKTLVDGGVANWVMLTTFGMGMLLLWNLMASGWPAFLAARK